MVYVIIGEVGYANHDLYFANPVIINAFVNFFSYNYHIC